MDDNQLTFIVNVVLAFIASTLLAIGTNGFTGASLFFAIWAMAGVIRINR